MTNMAICNTEKSGYNWDTMEKLWGYHWGNQFAYFFTGMGQVIGNHWYTVYK